MNALRRWSILEAVVPGAKLCCACFIKLGKSERPTETVAGYGHDLCGSRRRKKVYS